MLLVIGEKAEKTQTIRVVPTPVDYWVCTTFARERAYRHWFLKKEEKPLLELYRELARQFPQGLANIPPLPEEISGEVAAAWQERSTARFSGMRRQAVGGAA